MVDPEPIIDAGAAALRDPATGINAFITEANAGHADFDLALVDDASILPGGATNILKYPAVEIAAPDWDMSNVSLAQLSADLSMRVVVMCWVQHVDFQTLYRSSMRLAKAALSCLMQPDALSPTDERVVINAASGRYRFNPEANDRAEFTAGTLLLIGVEFAADRE